MGRRGAVFGVAVVEGFQVGWNRVVGAAPDALFQAGSISKPVSALVALKLVGRGVLDLEADVNERLTSWRLPGAERVSLRQLLGHTSGLGVRFYPGYRQGAEAPTVVQSLDGARPAATKPVRVHPSFSGSFHYSGGGYTVIQQLIADATGVPFAEAARDLVLRPLGMTSSTFAQPLPDGLRPRAARPDWRIYPEAAAAGLWTTPEDLARFATAVAAAAAGRGSAVRAEAAAQMVSVRALVPFSGELLSALVLGMPLPQAYGLGVFDFGDGRFGHVGGAVIMTAANPSRFPFRLLRAIGEEQGWTGFRVTGWQRLRDLLKTHGSSAH